MLHYTKRRTVRGQQQVYDSNTGTWISLAAVLFSDDDYQNLPNYDSGGGGFE